MPIISVDVGHVDNVVDLDDLDDRDLVAELVGRGYHILDNKHDVGTLTSDDIHVLMDTIDVVSPRIGSMLYDIREKLARLL